MFFFLGLRYFPLFFLSCGLVVCFTLGFLCSCKLLMTSLLEM